MRRGEAAAAGLADGTRLLGRGRRIVELVVVVVLAVLGAVVGGLLPWWACFCCFGGWVLRVVVWMSRG